MLRALSIRNIIGLLIGALINSCSHGNHHTSEKFYGIYIDHFLRQGSGYIDSTGTQYWYTYVKTIITNDSVIPARVTINLPKDYFQLSNTKRYKVLVIPDSSLAENEIEDYNLVRGPLKKFFDTRVENPVILNTILNPKEEYTVYIALITEANNKMNPYLTLFSEGHKQNFWPSEYRNSKLAPTNSVLTIPDSALNKIIVHAENKLTLFLGVRIVNFLFNDSLKYYNIIPCGEISYLTNN